MRFRIRQSTDVYMTSEELDKLVNPYSDCLDEFEQNVRYMMKDAKESQEVQFYGGGGMLDLWVHPNGVIEITSNVMSLDMEEDE